MCGDVVDERGEKEAVDLEEGADADAIAAAGDLVAQKRVARVGEETAGLTALLDGEDAETGERGEMLLQARPEFLQETRRFAVGMFGPQGGKQGCVVGVGEQLEFRRPYREADCNSFARENRDGVLQRRGRDGA